MTDHCLVRYQCILHCCIIVQVSLRSRHEIITQQATGLQISGHIYLSYLLLQDFKSCFFKKKKKLKRKKRSLGLGQSLVYCCKCLCCCYFFSLNSSTDFSGDDSRYCILAVTTESLLAHELSQVICDFLMTC